MITFANNHIINKVRFALKDKNDVTFTIEDKIQITNDSLSEYNKNIFSLKMTELSPTDNKTYKLPAKFKREFLLRQKLSNYEINNKTKAYVNSYLKENVDYIITGDEIKLLNSINYLNYTDNTISTSNIELTYEFENEWLFYENLWIAYVKWNDVEIVATASEYDVWEYIMIKGTLEQVVIVKTKTDTTITVDLLEDIAIGDTIIWNVKTPAEDINILLHYVRYIEQIQASSTISTESWTQWGRSYSVWYNSSSSSYNAKSWAMSGMLWEFYNMLDKHPRSRNKEFKGLSIFTATKE